MSSKQDLINEVLSLPIEDRAFIIDSLIKSMNPTNSDIEREWIKVTQKRLNDLKTGKVQGISGKKVFDDIWNRFEK
ncbi:addiction module protein [candidate division KSB1 bacterium]|nr:addiction module protein [candidate division KSB1 bacterium]